MKTGSFLVIVCVGLLLAACSRSKDPQYYVLNPVSPQAKYQKHYPDIRIGIMEVTAPDYLDKQQLAVYHTKNQSKLDENYQWAEELEGNIKRVIRTNLSTLLPQALVEQSPWDIKFKPNRELQVSISQFKVDIHGNSVLQAEYIIFTEDNSAKKYTASYFQKLTVVNPETLVISMNENLTRLTQDIAKNIRL